MHLLKQCCLTCFSISFLYTFCMYDLISVGMVTVDLFYQGESLTQNNGRFQLAVGGKYFADAFHMNIGGGATNVAIGATVQGMKVGLLAHYSQGPLALYITQQLDVLHIDRSMCVAVENFSNISSIFVSKQGERTIVNYRTPHQHLLDTFHAHIRPDTTRSIYLANLPDIAIAERIRFLDKCKSNGILTFSNLGVSDCRKSGEEIEAYLRSIDVLIVNRYEFADMVKKPYDVLDFHNNVKKIYFPHLTHITMVITGGSKGSWGYSNERVWYEKATPVEKVVDTTGAGDAYTAGFIASYLKESNVQKAMANGSQYAARIISGMGTSETR